MRASDSRTHRLWAVLGLLAGLAGAPAGAVATGAEDLLAGPSSDAVVEAVGPPRPEESPLGDVSEVDPVRMRLERAWRLPAAGLSERVGRTQQSGLEIGMRDLDAVARAVLIDPSAGSAIERARAAVELAPGLPAAHFAMARALLLEAHDPAGAWLAARAGIERVAQHLEARLYVQATLWSVGAVAAIAAACLFLLAGLANVLPGTLRGLDALPGGLPAPSRLALVACALLLPAVLGEGLVGVALAAAVLVVAQTGWQGRFAVIAAGGLLVVGIYPLLDRTGEAIDALASDGFARSVWTVEHGLPLPAELARLSGKPDQRIVRSALAVRARREGRREEAVAAYAALGPGPEARNLNNAASLALAAGRNDDAITLLEAAARQTDIALVRVNLAQAYGAAVRLEQQELALAEAQSLDERGVRDLSRALNGAPIATTLDLPIGFSELAPALVDPAEASAITGGLRERVAPGWLGSGAGMAAAGWILSLGLGLLVGHRFGDSSGSTDYYAGMARLLKEGGVDAAERADRLVALREQQDRIDRVQRILAWLLPGAGGWLGGFPLLGLMACLALAGACALLVVAPLPDPHAIGAGTRWLSLGPALLLGGLYAALTAFSLRAGGSR